MLTRLREWWGLQSQARRVQLTVGAAGAALVTLVVAAVLLGRGDEAPGVVVTAATRTPTASATATATVALGEPGLPTITTLAELASTVGDPPDATRGRFRIPSLRVDAPLGARAVGEGGTMPLPAGPADVVMYEFAPQWLGEYGGSLGGGAGNVVFSGHLDFQARVPYAPVNYGGPGVFAGISRLNPGDIIEVVPATAGGRTLTYVVEWRRSVPAATETWAEVLGRNVGGEAITLITCGGAFSLQTLEYDARVVVRALRQP